MTNRRDILKTTLAGGVGLLFAGNVFGAEKHQNKEANNQINSNDVTITDFGARTDLPNNAEAIQKAIDHCAANGGGIVRIPQGTFNSGTIILKDRIHLWLHPNAELKGIPDLTVYYRRGLVLAVKAKDISIIGSGTLNGNGSHPDLQFGNNSGRCPHLVELLECTNVLIQDVKLYNSASWTLRLHLCDGVRVHNIILTCNDNWNCDGVDINSKNVILSNSVIDCDDDAICLKSDSADFIVENVTVTNCIVASSCNAIKLGTQSRGGFRNVSISNCVVRKVSGTHMQNWSTRISRLTAEVTVISGIALEVVDGGFMDRVVISNISMQDVQTPLFIRLGNRRGRGTLKNVIISGITARNESLITSSITGIPSSYVENVTIRDIFFDYMGGGDEKDASITVPEKENEYPENRMFGDVLPSYGLYVRHVKNLTIENFQCIKRQSDARPVFIFDDVHNLWINNFQTEVPENNAPIMRLIESSDFVVSGFRTQQTVPLFLKAEGQSSKNIDIRSNDFSRIQRKAIIDGAIEIKQ